MSTFARLFLCVFLTAPAVYVPAQQPTAGGLSALYSPSAAHDEADRVGEYHLVVADVAAFRAFLQTPEAAAMIRETGHYAPARVITVRARRAVLDSVVARHPLVGYIDRADRRPREELAVPGHNLYANKINALHAEFPALDGRGRTISIKENRFDTADVDLRNRARVAPGAQTAVNDHAGIMATLAAGAGTSDEQARGVARGARLVSMGFGGILPEPPAVYAQFDVSVQNHSYGVDVENWYGADALAFDQSVAERPALLHVFSAGNRGLENDTFGPYASAPGYGNLTGSFKMAKNAVLVGAIDSFGRVIAPSSRGPAYDGRLKPDLVAYGQDGTSGAAALVSGTAAVLQQAYAEQNGGQLPPAAWTRALLLNTAADVGPPGIDYTSGYGNLDAQRAVHTAHAGQWWQHTVEFGTGQGREVAVPPGLRRLKVLLTWDDAPATPGAARALVNDLDLYVERTGNPVLIRPWVLSSAPQSDSLQLPAVRRRDSLNTTEQVVLDFPVAGTYIFLVNAHSLPAGAQAFTLTWTWDSLGAVRWTYPAHGEALPPGAAVVLRWQGAAADSLAALEYRVLPDAAWTAINAQQSLETGWARWTVPGLDAPAPVQFRLRTASGAEWRSDTALIARRLDLRVGFDCPDSVLLAWNRLDGDVVYRLWGLGDYYLEPLFDLLDTSVVLPKPQWARPRYAVGAVLPGAGGLELPPGDARDPATQGVQCYFQSLLADLQADGRVALTLRLGTDYGVGEIGIERLEPGGTTRRLGTWPAAGPQYATIDDAPLAGANRYRAILRMNNGGVLYSDTVVVTAPGDRDVLLWPNPVPRGQVLQIVSRNDGMAQFTLYDLQGRVVLEQQIAGPVEVVDLGAVPAGVYAFVFRAEGRPGVGGKVVVY